MKSPEMRNITGCLLLDANAAFLNGAGLDSGENKNKVIPKTFWESLGNRKERVPYVSAQSWRRWLRNTTNEENGWEPSVLRAVDQSNSGTTNKIATELNPVDYPEDDIFGYMSAGSGKKGTESVQRTSAFKSSILKGIPGKRSINTDEGFVHLKEGSPLPYSTEFYSSVLEGFFNLEYSRLGVYDNYASKVELSKELIKKAANRLETEKLGDHFERFKIKNGEKLRKERAAGLLRGIGFLRGGAKQSAFGSDVAPQVIILAGMQSANPIFHDLFSVKEQGHPELLVGKMKDLVKDYSKKLATPVYIGIREGFILNQDELAAAFPHPDYVIDSPIGIVNRFIESHLS